MAFGQQRRVPGRVREARPDTCQQVKNKGEARTRDDTVDSNGTPMELRRNRLAMVRRARALREAFKGTHTKCPSAKEHSEDKELSERSLARNVHHRPLAERLHAQPLPLSLPSPAVVHHRRGLSEKF